LADAETIRAGSFPLTTKETVFSDALSSFVGNKVNVQADRLLIQNARLIDYRDRNLERPPDERKPMFVGMVDSIPFPLNIDTIQIKSAHITYEERQENTSESMVIDFNEVFGSFYNVTNIQQAREKSRNLEIDLIGKVNNAGALSVRLNLPYEKRNFEIMATYEDAPLSTFNRTFIPLAGISFEDGMLKKFELRMNGNYTAANNILYFSYHNLKVNVLDRGNEQKEKKGILSLIANAAIHHSNLPEEKHFRVAEYQSERNIYRSPFNYIAHTISEGLILIVPRKVVSKAILKEEYNTTDKRKSK